MPSTIDLTNLTVSFQYYSTISVGSIGFITNLMNIHVSLSSEIQKTSMGFSNICLSITHIFTIIITRKSPCILIKLYNNKKSLCEINSFL
jgi:hypothetical protein